MQELFLWVLFFLLNYEKFNIFLFLRFCLFHFCIFNHVFDFFYFPQKLIKKANNLI